MARDKTEKVRAAAEAVLVDGETVTSKGVCWAVQRRGRVPLPLLARRQYLLALTDRRILVFERGRRPKPSDLVLGKRYETFTLERVRRGFPLLQVRVSAANGNRMVFEFRPGNRELGGELIARLTPRAPQGDAAPEPALAVSVDASADASDASDAPRPLPTVSSDDDLATTTESEEVAGAATAATNIDDGSGTHPEAGALLDAAQDPVSPWAPNASDNEPSTSRADE